MTEQMNMLYLTEVGHVLSAFTRSAEPSSAEDKPDSFVGQGLHVRGLGDMSDHDFNTRDFVIPPENLSVLRVKLDLSQLLQSRNYYVEDSKALHLIGTSSLTGPVVFDATTRTLKFNFPGPPAPQPAAGTKVVALIEGAAPTISVSDKVTLPLPGNTMSLTLPSLASGSYHALICAQIYPILVFGFLVP